MNKKIYFVADFFLDDIIGGGELNNEEFIEMSLKNSVSIKKIKTNEITLDFLKTNKNENFIIANFICLNVSCKEFIEKNCNYVIYEHDHKYLASRNPALYKDFMIPENLIINRNFYKMAKKIFCQSSFQKEILEKNLKLKNAYNLSGNIWSLNSLEHMSSLNKNIKKDLFAIMDSNILHKNTQGAISFCLKNNIKFELIKHVNYHDFLEKLSDYKGLVFLPQTPETLSRVVVEARMLGLKTYTNKLIGACYEKWYIKKSDELIDIMKNKREEINKTILEYLNA